MRAGALLGLWSAKKFCGFRGFFLVLWLFLWLFFVYLNRWHPNRILIFPLMITRSFLIKPTAGQGLRGSRPFANGSLECNSPVPNRRFGITGYTKNIAIYKYTVTTYNIAMVSISNFITKELLTHALT